MFIGKYFPELIGIHNPLLLIFWRRYYQTVVIDPDNMGRLGGI